MKSTKSRKKSRGQMSLDDWRRLNRRPAAMTVRPTGALATRPSAMRKSASASAAFDLGLAEGMRKQAGLVSGVRGLASRAVSGIRSMVKRKPNINKFRGVGSSSAGGFGGGFSSSTDTAFRAGQRAGAKGRFGGKINLNETKKKMNDVKRQGLGAGLGIGTAPRPVTTSGTRSVDKKPMSLKAKVGLGAAAVAVPAGIGIYSGIGGGGQQPQQQQRTQPVGY